MPVRDSVSRLLVLVVVVLLHGWLIGRLWPADSGRPPAPVITPPRPILVELLSIPAPEPAPAAPVLPASPAPPPVEPPAKPPPTPPAAPVKPPPKPKPAVKPKSVAKPQPAPQAAAKPKASEPGPPALIGPVAGRTDRPAQPSPSAPAAELPVTAPLFAAAYLNNPPPAYPPLAKRSGQQGTVKLRVKVSAAGQAEAVELHTSSGVETLDQAAVQAVRRWRFVPAKRGTEPVSAWVLVPISFRLKG